MMKVLLSTIVMAMSLGYGQAQSTPPPAGQAYCCGRTTAFDLTSCDPCTAGNTCNPAVTCEPMAAYCTALGKVHCAADSNSCCDGLGGPISAACGDSSSDGYCNVDPPTTTTTATPPSGGGGKGAGGQGDPHFKTWNGTWYDFHGICDLVLLQDDDFANGLGLTIHVRTKGRWEYAYIETAAIKIGDDTLEVSSFGDYMMDGISKADMPAEIGNGQFLVEYQQKSEKQHEFLIHLGNKDEAIKIGTYKDLVSVNIVEGTNGNFGSALGMMGSYADGLLVARDGSTVMDDVNKFGQEWQVLASEPQLFQAPSPFVGQACVPPKITGSTTKGRRLGEAISREAAEMACAHLKEEEMRDMCIFDVIAMNDLDVANAQGAF